MKRCSTLVLIAALMIAPVTAEEVPFAKPPSQRSPSVGTLANIMINVQIRHSKLWFAGKARNWDLLGFEAQKLEDDLIAAVGFYSNIPIENVDFSDKPLKRLMQAARTKDYSLYATAFDELTAGCNSCHAAGQVGFIRIQKPKSPPFSNQAYER